MNEALDLLFIMLDKTIIKEMKSKSLEEMIQYHHGLGQWIRNNWLLWDMKSEISIWFKENYNVTHGDDKSGLILDAFWHRLNDKPFDIEKEVEKIHQYWKDAEVNNVIQSGKVLGFKKAGKVLGFKKEK
ncbi:MAG: hypothetical protein RBR32_03670 [Bacteroidales bacterium]|nr:hypothetical protein [Bacteroidales bacterium]